MNVYVPNILSMVYTLRFFSSKCSLFHNSTVFGSCVIHILYTECAKIIKNNSGPKWLIMFFYRAHPFSSTDSNKLIIESSVLFT